MPSPDWSLYALVSPSRHSSPIPISHEAIWKMLYQIQFAGVLLVPNTLFPGPASRWTPGSQPSMTWPCVTLQLQLLTSCLVPWAAWQGAHCHSLGMCCFLLSHFSSDSELLPQLPCQASLLCYYKPFLGGDLRTPGAFVSPGAQHF